VTTKTLKLDGSYELVDITIGFTYRNREGKERSIVGTYEIIDDPLNPAHFTFDTSRIDGLKDTARKGSKKSKLENVSERLLVNLRAIVRHKKTKTK
jgi:hypothetical protein